MARSGLARWAILAVVWTMAPGCSDTTVEVDPDDIHVVAVLPLTGNYSSRGEKHRAALQMAFRDAEAQGELLPGRRIRVWEVDGGSGSRDEVEARIRQLIDERLTVGGRVLVAAIFSSTATAHEASLPVALEKRIPHFEVSSGSKEDEFIKPTDARYRDMSNEAFREMLSYAFSSRALCYEEAILTAEYIAQRWPDGKLALMRGTKEHDRMHTQVIRDRLAELARTEGEDGRPRWRGTIVTGDEDYRMRYPDGSGQDDESGATLKEWREHIQAVVEAHSPDVIFFHLRGDKHNFDFFKDWKRVGEGDTAIGSVPVVTCNMAEKKSLLDPVNPGVIDFLEGRLWFVGRWPFTDATGNARWGAFQDDFRSSNPGLSPDKWSAGVYDAAMVLSLAIVRAGTTDPAPLRDAIVDVSGGGRVVGYGEVAEAFRLVRSGVDIDYEGASGPMDQLPPPPVGDVERFGWIVPGVYQVDEIVRDGEAWKFQKVADVDRKVLPTRE